MLGLQQSKSILFTNDRANRSKFNERKNQFIAHSLSDSEGEVITRKPKTIKLFNSDDDESDNDEKSEKSSGFVHHSDDSQGSSKSLSSKNESDDERRKATVRNNKPNDSPVKSKKSDSSDDERRSQPKKSRSSSSSSDDEKTPRSRKSSTSSNSSNQGKPSQSRKSRSNSSSSERSRSRKSSSSSSSSGDEKKSQSRKSRSSSSSSDDEKKSQSRKSRSSSNSSSDGKRSQSRKSRSSSSSSSDGKRSQSRKSRSSSSSSGDEKQTQSRKSRNSSSGSSDGKRSQSRKSRSSSSSSDDEIRPRLKKSGKKSSSSGDKKLSKCDSSDNETHSQSKRSNSSDNDSRSACSQISNKNNASDNEKPASSPKPTKADSNNAQQKSSGKYSLITASDLESEDDTRPVMNESMSDDDLRLKSNKKSKKLLKKKSTSSKKSAHSKSNGLSEAFDSSGSDDEERSSPKRVQKSAAKRKSETKTPKDSKASKKEKDPLLSIRSETQRMIREGRISLPYHQPKQRSLHEFLQRRKTAPSIPLKATPEVLRNVCEQLINKEKEVEDFYKSESDNSETEDQPSNLPETETEGANDIVKDIESASTDLPVDKEAPAVEMELDKDTNSTLTNNNESRNPPSDVSEQNKDTNSTLIDDSPERVDPESNKNDDPVLEKSDESPSMENPTEPITTEENPTKPITEDGSNPQPTPKDDKIIPMDVDEDTNAPKDSQDLVSITKSNEPATEQVNERDMPDSEDFVLQIEDSCSNYTDDITKPSNLPAPEEPPSNEITKPSNPLASEMLPDSSDFELRIEDSCNDTETPTEIVPASEAEKISANSAESTSKPVISKDRLKNRIEALLSTRKIKLSSINLNSAPEPIQFEIPSFQPEPTGIRDLKEKFVKHSLAKKKPKSTPSQVNVVTTQTDTEGGVIGVSKETLTMSLNDEENEFSNPKLKVPGAKHAYLKKKMLDMLISKKEATWNEYQNEKRKYYGSDDEENDIDGDNDDDDSATCKKLNFEPYHPEDEPDDDELVEDDVVYEEKNRDKNCFVDEEAEVSELEDEEDDNPAEQDDADNGEDDDDDDDDKDSVDSDGLDFHVKDDSPSKPDQSNDNAESSKLFKYNTTGFDLEKKLLGLESISQTNLNDDVSASQIFGLCSGTFATQQQPRSNTAFAANEDDDFFIDSQNAEDSQNICLSLPDTDNTVEKTTEASNKDPIFKLNDTPEDEEEEEEEIFTRKKPTMRIVEDSDDETTDPTNEANADASDEDNCIDDQDEDEADGENIEDEEEEGAEGADDIEAEEFGYDSEEELVSYDKPSAREFFENEAELSESEWGSEDENEKDLDKLEKEEGDDDEIDADKLKEELGKIHMRQLLDDDQHDVRLLKEMLLEDGELHSDAKRQRKFQWKSLTDGDDFFKNYSYDSDDEINLNDDDNDNDESEEHWRKIRHERETFLLQQEKKSKLNDTVTESVESTFASTKIIDESIVTKIVQRTSFSSTANTSKDKPDQDLSKTNSKIKCGSFLSRGKLLLSKMTLSVSETKENLHGAKNSRNFVFGARSPKKEQVPVTVEKTEKRKSTSTSVSVPKKVRLSVDNETNPARRKGLLARLALTE